MSFDFIDPGQLTCVCGTEISQARYRTYGRCDDCLFAAFAVAEWDVAFLRKLKGWAKQDDA